MIIYQIYQSECKIEQNPHLHLYSLKSLFTFKQKTIPAICRYLFFRFSYVKKLSVILWKKKPNSSISDKFTQNVFYNSLYTEHIWGKYLDLTVANLR